MTTNKASRFYLGVNKKNKKPAISIDIAGFLHYGGEGN